MLVMNNKIRVLLDNGVNRNTFKHINAGGCGAFAVAMYRALDKVGIHSDIVLVDLGYSEHDVNYMINIFEASDINNAYEKVLAGEANKYCTCIGHVCVMVDGVLYDGEGVYLGDPISEPINVNIMEQLVRDHNIWNETFMYYNFKYPSIESFRELIEKVGKHVETEVVTAA